MDGSEHSPLVALAAQASLVTRREDNSWCDRYRARQSRNETVSGTQLRVPDTIEPTCIPLTF